MLCEVKTLCVLEQGTDLADRPQWRIQNFEKGVSDSATPTLALPFYVESAEFLSMLSTVLAS